MHIDRDIDRRRLATTKVKTVTNVVFSIPT